MALSQATLATELEAMTPTMSEATAIDNFATAFKNYFLNSTVNGIGVNAGSLDFAEAAMKTAMVGLSTTGAASMSAGIVAFWGNVSVSGPLIWTLVPPIISVTIPPLLGTLTAAISATFVANQAAELSLADAADALAATIHPVMLGGIAVITPPPAVSFPIL